MPVLITRKTRKIILPSTAHLPADQQIIVEVKDRAKLKDIEEMNTAEGNSITKTAHGLASFIVDWNATDETGQKLDITFENIMELEMPDYNALNVDFSNAMELSKQSGVTDDEKKTSSDTLTPPSTLIAPQQ